MDVTIIIGKKAVRAVRCPVPVRGAHALDVQGYGVHWRRAENIWLTPAQAGKILGVSRWRARVLARSEGWNMRKVGQRNLMPLTDALAYLETLGLDKGGV